MQDKKINVKLTVIGGNKAGKTSIISNFVNEDIDAGSTTLASDCYKLYRKIEHKGALYNMKIDLWDTPGMGDSILPTSVLRDSDCFLLVFDLSQDIREEKLLVTEQIQ